MRELSHKDYNCQQKKYINLLHNAMQSTELLYPLIKIKIGTMADLNLYGRGDKIRTCDPLHPMQVLYQA
ncbi:MAG: hypothetical protein J6K82_00845, partial [Alphaproteobacteria bacterium]|nr:hypothetical protein [Alphaproteobacteria bacterium]